MKKKSMPFIAVSNDELGEEVGEYAECPHCGKQHLVKYGDRKLPNGKLVPSTMLGYVKCGKSAYVVAINKQIWKKK
jgi:hypothetical protein